MVLKLAKVSLILLAILAVSVNEGKDGVQALSFNQSFNGLGKKPAPKSASVEDVKYFVIQQPIDHFNAYETKHWKMRYIVNDDVYRDGGPLFIFVGGGAITSSARITRGHIYDMAREHNAYLVHMEHRFYGESRPFKDMKTENLEYLTTFQALDDLYQLILITKKRLGIKELKVILFGCSYGGALVTWFNVLYPGRANGGWASSASLLAEVNLRNFHVLTSDAIHEISGCKCKLLIRNGIYKLEEMVAENRSAELKKLLNICDNFDVGNKLDVSNLFFAISIVFSTVVQNNVKDEIFNLCRKMLNEVDAFQGFINYIKSNNPSESCVDYTYESEVRWYQQTSFDSNNGRQRLFQQCNEFGWYRTTDAKKKPFGTKISLEYFTSLCRDVFGNKFSQDYTYRKVALINRILGGLSPRVANVYITQGKLDPWREVGLVQANRTTVIPRIGRCKDFDSISDDDSDELKASKNRVKWLIRQWLRD